MKIIKTIPYLHEAILRFIYLTNTPSFYKLNLCHEIAQQHSLLLVLYGYGSEAVNKVLTGNSGGFDYYFLDDGDATGATNSGFWRGCCG